MKKVIAGLKVGLAFVVAGVVSLILFSLWLAWGWAVACIVVLVAVGTVIALRAIFRRRGGKV